ncbi:hypothetical protein BSL78_09467 [Apostichopus japonicus]|uniref:Uncharacterized protein n=2 Tax=Stichopus japonicus TaxID=307972 RepID=A0A2G8L021_STIJA|nr:hypothetical protein BSL78_09467 [Apostichopus japonicus]
MFSLTAIFINVVVAAMQVPEGYEGAINVFLIILNVLVLVIIAGEILLVIARHLWGMHLHRELFIFLQKGRMLFERKQK